LRQRKKRLRTLKSWRTNREEKARLILAAILAAAALLDNVTTVLALQRGAVEANPLVAVFTANLFLFSIFTAVKVSLAFYAVYKTFSKSVAWIAIYTIVLAVFIRATIINTINALT
jgi:hypothetical protein